MTLIAPPVTTTCRIAQGEADVAACQALRHMCFHGAVGLDADAFDARSDHVMIEQDGVLVCTMRLRVLDAGADMATTYTGQHYSFEGIDGPALEIGRFCTSGGPFSLDVLRWAWIALLAYVDRFNIVTLFGCTSFQGTDPAQFDRGLAVLHDRYLSDMQITPRNAGSLPLAQFANMTNVATYGFPQLTDLQISYLRLGGRVSDHLIVDHALNTLHVFLCLRVADIPPARVASLRRTAAQTTGLHIPARRNT